MAYPERKPIYTSYEKIISKIIEHKSHKEYAESEIEELDKELLHVFREIRIKCMINKKWSN